METTSVCRKRIGRWVRLGTGCCLFGILAHACVFDPSDRCGPNEAIYGDNVLCVCIEGTVKTDKGCAPCGANEVVQAGACACAPGYAKPTGGGPCQLTATSGQGAACDPQNAPCADATYNHCQAANGSGYCTKTGCTSSAECSGGYACDTSITPSVCRRPPVGLRTPCTSDSDCAGTEATYCDTYSTKSCLVKGCILSANNCFEGYECCDLSNYGVAEPLCVVKGNCTK